MKTLKQFTETMMVPLMTNKKFGSDDYNDIYHTFEYEGDSYKISIVNMGRDHEGKRAATISFHNVNALPHAIFMPTQKNSGQFRILATVIHALEDAFNHGYDIIRFSGELKKGKLYRKIAMSLKATSKYNIEINDIYNNQTFYGFTVTQK